MADYCNYRIHARGRRAACLMLFLAMPCADSKELITAEGTADDFVIHFESCCKYSLDAYCKPYDGTIDCSGLENIKLDADEEIAESDLYEYEELGLPYWYITMQQKSELLQLEIQAQTWMHGEGYIGMSHWKNGEVISEDDVPWPDGVDPYEDPDDDGFDF